jgi:ubiquinone/menaquinone biosynthesis C-methylase UbiE
MVLEHVSNDTEAMLELFRVLKPGGWAIVQVPIDKSRDITFEDPYITSPDERERAFGQYDHLRLYGLLSM